MANHKSGSRAIFIQRSSLVDSPSPPTAITRPPRYPETKSALFSLMRVDRPGLLQTTAKKTKKKKNFIQRSKPAASERSLQIFFLFNLFSIEKFVNHEEHGVQLRGANITRRSADRMTMRFQLRLSGLLSAFTLGEARYFPEKGPRRSPAHKTHLFQAGFGALITITAISATGGGDGGPYISTFFQFFFWRPPVI